MKIVTNNQQQQRAFTLLEMLISVTLFALMAAMAYSGLSQVIRSSGQINESNQTLADLQFSLSSIERDVLQLSQRSIRDEYGDEQAALVIDGEKMTFSRLGWPNFIGAQRSHIQRVQYELKDKKLIRSYWLTLDRTIDQKPIQSVLMNNVSALSFNVMDANKKSFDKWPNQVNLQGEQPSTVKAVEISIEIESWGEIKKLIELQDEVS